MFFILPESLVDQCLKKFTFYWRSDGEARTVLPIISLDPYKELLKGEFDLGF